MLRDYDRKVMEIISVDDFDTREMAAGAQPESEEQPRPSTVGDFHVA
jgi:hypothetical protein